MRLLLVKPALHLKGEINLLGDKSIAHRSVIISAITQGKTTIENFPTNKDCIYTVKAFKNLGVRISQKLNTHKGSSTITVFGKGLYGLRKPKDSIFVGDSGTTLRILLGVLAGQNFAVKLTVGKSLSRRPMLRVTSPLRMMGARINAKRIRLSHGQETQNAKLEEYPPITIKGGNLKPITYKMPVASAQVKSAILLAGLYVKGTTQIIEHIKTRDHTERMLKLFRADIKLRHPPSLKLRGIVLRSSKSEGGQNKIVIKGNRELVSPRRIYIPGDISSASFFIVLATILPDSEILIRNVNLNPSRIGIIKVLRRMGADIKVSKYQSIKVSKFEPMGDLCVKSSKLKGAIVKREETPSLIDELPILMVAACLARGRTILEGVSELRVKETDRTRSISENLRKMGADISVVKGIHSEKIIIKGVNKLKGCRVRSFGDHRTAMSMVVAGLVAKDKTFIDDITCINKSFPEFLSILRKLIK